jgi:hypothetical protein
MSLSESFEPDALSQNLKPEQPWFSGESAPAILTDLHSEATEINPPYLHWQEHLLPLSCITQEDNVTVLRLELETAHQLLQYQQAAMDTLSEQLTNRDLALQHTQDELSAVQQACHAQTSQLTEFGAICRDLKMQLRRQQQRVLQYRDLLKTAQLTGATTASGTPNSSDPILSFGYPSISIEAHPPAKVQKLPPVSAWSAPDSIDLTGPLACYRELATIRMTTARIRLETKPLAVAQKALALPFASTDPHQPEPQAVEPATPRVELPHFTRS